MDQDLSAATAAFPSRGKCRWLTRRTVCVAACRAQSVSLSALTGAPPRLAEFISLFGWFAFSSPVHHLSCLVPSPEPSVMSQPARACSSSACPAPLSARGFTPGRNSLNYEFLQAVAKIKRLGFVPMIEFCFQDWNNLLLGIL